MKCATTNPSSFHATLVATKLIGRLMGSEISPDGDSVRAPSVNSTYFAPFHAANRT